MFCLPELGPRMSATGVFLDVTGAGPDDPELGLAPPATTELYGRSPGINQYLVMDSLMALCIALSNIVVPSADICTPYISKYRDSGVIPV